LSAADDDELGARVAAKDLAQGQKEIQLALPRCDSADGADHSPPVIGEHCIEIDLGRLKCVDINTIVDGDELCRVRDAARKLMTYVVRNHYDSIGEPQREAVPPAKF